MSRSAPTIETTRLTLRGHVREDFEHTYALWSDPIVTKYIGGRPFTREECWSRLLRYVGHWALVGYGYWAVFERASGRFVGDVGFIDGKRGLPQIDGVPEGGWVLMPWAHGRGFTTEVMAAAIAFIESPPVSAKRTTCLIDVDNAASIGVARKLGYRELERATYNEHPVVLFERRQ